MPSSNPFLNKGTTVKTEPEVQKPVEKIEPVKPTSVPKMDAFIPNIEPVTIGVQKPQTANLDIKPKVETTATMEKKKFELPKFNFDMPKFNLK
jgi:hypothetical protein